MEPNRTTGRCRSYRLTLWSVALVAAGCSPTESLQARAAEPPPSPLSRQADLPSAQDHFEADPATSYTTAEQAYRERRWAEATVLYRRKTERAPNVGWNYYMLGLSAWRAGHLTESEFAFARVLELDPSHTKSMLNLSRVLLEDQRPEDALRYAQAAVDRGPRASVAHRVLGQAYEALVHNQAAIDSYRTAIELHPRDVWAMNRLGMLLSEEGRHTEALAPLARTVELRSDVASLQVDLGLVLERIGRYYAAGTRYQAALAIEGSNEVASLGYARVELLSEPPGPRWVDLRLLARTFADELETAIRQTD